jgi:hypothetical protein
MIEHKMTEGHINDLVDRAMRDYGDYLKNSACSIVSIFMRGKVVREKIDKDTWRERAVE